MSLSNVRVRPANRTDLDAILALEAITREAPHWPLASYAKILEPPGTLDAQPISRCLIVACSESALAGFAVGLAPPVEVLVDASTRTARDLQPRIEAVAELESVAVAGFARRMGVGRTLCAAVIDWCRARGATTVTLEVRAKSDAAIALYTGLSFVRAGVRPKYYSKPQDDAILMRLDLDPKANSTARVPFDSNRLRGDGGAGRLHTDGEVAEPG